MGAGHGHRVHYHGHSALHRARPELKVLAVLLGMLAVVATPHQWWPLFVLYAAVLLAGALSLLLLYGAG